MIFSTVYQNWVQSISQALLENLSSLTLSFGLPICCGKNLIFLGLREKKYIKRYKCSWIQVAEQNRKWFHIHGFRARAIPYFGFAAWVAFESYSAEKVISDLGLHSCWYSIAALPLSENRVFTTVNGSTAWELPMVKLFSREENLWVISAATEWKGFTEWT